MGRPKDRTGARWMQCCIVGLGGGDEVGPSSLNSLHMTPHPIILVKLRETPYIVPALWGFVASHSA